MKKKGEVLWKNADHWQIACMFNVVSACALC